MKNAYRIRNDNRNHETSEWEKDNYPTHCSSMAGADVFILGMIEGMIGEYLNKVEGDNATTFNLSIDMGHAKFRVEKFSKVREYALRDLQAFLKKNTVRKALNSGIAIYFVRVGRFEEAIYHCIKTDKITLW